MKLRERLTEDKRYRTAAGAVGSFILHLSFALYNGIFGVMTASGILVVSAGYYLLLAGMRLAAVLLDKKGRTVGLIGILLIVLGLFFPVMVLVSMRYQTATVYGEIVMITIATFTTAKITAAAVTAARHRRDSTRLYRALNAVRYAEVAVSLLTMQQSMLVSFGEMEASTSTILNACTGAGVCVFILLLGIVTLRKQKKEQA